MKPEWMLFWSGVFGVALFLFWILRTRLVHVFLDTPDRRKVHQRQVPRIGGFGVLLIFLGSTSIAFLNGLLQPTGLSFMLVVGALVFLVIGLLDDSSLIYYLRRWRDRRNGIEFTDPKGWSLRVRYKFILEFSLVIFACSQLFPGLPLWVWAVLVVWLVGVSNSFNIIDGIDGLCGGVAFFTMLTLAFLGYRLGVPEVTSLALLLAGAALGFLLLNHHPAQLFLGDMGSLFFGFASALLALKLVAVAPHFAPSALFYLAGLPVLDVFAAMIRRFFISAGPGASLRHRIKCMVSADSNHIHHRLLAQGLGHMHAALILYILASVFLVAGLLTLTLPAAALVWVHLYMIAVTGVAVAGIFYQDRLHHIGRFFKSRLVVAPVRRYRIGLISGGPLLDQALNSSTDHTFDFESISDEDSWIKSRGLLDGMLLEQGETESFDHFLSRLKVYYAESDIPCVVLSESPLAIASLVGELLPQGTVSLPNRPLYIHPVLMHLAHQVGATQMVVSEAVSPRQTLKIPVVCANS